MLSKSVAILCRALRRAAPRARRALHWFLLLELAIGFAMAETTTRSKKSQGLVGDCFDSELTFVVDKLRTNPQLLFTVSSMLRKGTLEQALDTYASKFLKSDEVVEKMLPGSTTTVRPMRSATLISLMTGLSPVVDKNASGIAGHIVF